MADGQDQWESAFQRKPCGLQLWSSELWMCCCMVCRAKKSLLLSISAVPHGKHDFDTQSLLVSLWCAGGSQVPQVSYNPIFTGVPDTMSGLYFWFTASLSERCWRSSHGILISENVFLLRFSKSFGSSIASGIVSGLCEKELLRMLFESISLEDLAS